MDGDPTSHLGHHLQPLPATSATTSSLDVLDACEWFALTAGARLLAGRDRVTEALADRIHALDDQNIDRNLKRKKSGI